MSISPNRVPERELWYKHSPHENRVPTILAENGTITFLAHGVVSNHARVGQVTAQMVTTLAKELSRRKCSAGLIERVGLCAGEAIPNAIEYGVWGSTVAVLLMTYGAGPDSVTILMVDNRLAAGDDPAIPGPDAVNRFEDILLERHGRGIAMMREFSEAMLILVDPGETVRTILFFSAREGE